MTNSEREIPRSRLPFPDLLRVAVVGLRTRKLRAALSALGIAIGIASLVAVLGLSESSKSDLLAQLDRLGTNLVTVRAGQGIGLGSAELPDEAAAMVARVGPVEETSAISAVDADVYRTDFIPEGQTGGISVQAVDLNLLETLNGSVASGRFLDEATSEYPGVVLGSVAAERMGLGFAPGPARIWLGGQWFAVVGVLDEFELSPDLDRAALIGVESARAYLDHEFVPTALYVRTDPTFIDDVIAVLPATANPENPEEIEVERPSDVLEAREAASDAFTNLFLGLGAVALLVGGVGIANVMVISVLERRSEIGLRRAIGATRRHVALQFLGEAGVLSLAGGVAGVVGGVAFTAIYAATQGWSVLIPPIAWIGGLVAALLIGVGAGLYPAVRASRLSPTEALRAS